MNVYRYERETGADADAVNPSDDSNPIDIARVVSTDRASSGQASRMDRHTKRHQAPGDDEFREHQRSGAFIGEGVERNLITLTRPGLLSDQGPMP
jgi:hypothetical protein